MSLLAAVAPHLPGLRRYARALTGDQAAGDSVVRTALQALAAGEETLDPLLTPRMALYAVFHHRLGGRLASTPTVDGHDATSRLLGIAPASRQAFLLTAMEGFTPEEAACVMGVDNVKLEALIVSAQQDIQSELATDVLVIEDEPVIAAYIEAIVLELGHRVSGRATTRDEARAAAIQATPGLVLADIQLADGSSGIDAVDDILADADVPVIFITALPELLLTGERPEPAFLIAKPFNPLTVKATIGQALFFHPRRTNGHS